MDAPFVIRAASADDMPALMRLQAQCHDAALLESEACFAGILAHGLSWVAVVSNDCHCADDVCAYALMHAGADSALNSVAPSRPAGALDAVFLHDVVVAPSHRKSGVGRALVATALAAAAADAFCGGGGEVHLVSLPAVVAYWERAGFCALETSAHDDASTYVSGARHMVRTLAAT